MLRRCSTRSHGRALGFSTQAFYQWKRDPVSRRDWGDAHLTNAAVDAHADDPELGYRLIADELRHAGHHVSETGAPTLRPATAVIHARQET